MVWRHIKVKDFKNLGRPIIMFLHLRKDHWGKRNGMGLLKVTPNKDNSTYRNFNRKDREDFKHHPPKQHQRGTKFSI